MPVAESTQVGQWVVVDSTKHHLPLNLLNEPLEILTVEGAGDDAFVTLKGPRGVISHFGYPEIFRVTELSPAPAIVKPGKAPRVVSSDAEEKVHMNAETKLMNLATTIAKTKGIRLADAAKEASLQLKNDEIDEYRGGSPAPAARASVTSLSVTDLPGVARLRAATQRVAREEGLSLVDAADKVLCDRLPDAGATVFELRVQQLRAGGLDACSALLRASQEDPTGAEAYRLAGL